MLLIGAAGICMWKLRSWEVEKFGAVSSRLSSAGSSKLPNFIIS